MNRSLTLATALCVTMTLTSHVIHAQSSNPALFQPEHIFELEYADDPRISPDGSEIVYARTSMDIMTDRAQTNLWITNYDGSGHRPLVTGDGNYASPRWSPDGKRLVYIATDERGKRQIFLRWMDNGQTTMLTHLQESPGGVSWSPNSQWIAFNMFVPEPAKPFADLPNQPEGAKWAPPATTYERLIYRRDVGGFLPIGHSQIFILPAEGGTPRQMTDSPYNHEGTPQWTPDSQHLLISANRRDDWEYRSLDSEVYEITIADRSVQQLTDRRGPDNNPVASPNGQLIAYTGFDDRFQGYQVDKLYVMNRDGSGSKLIADQLDRDIQNLQWSSDGQGLFFQYDTEGNTRVAFVTLDGKITDLATDVGGLSLGRPYSGALFTVAKDGRFAFTHSTPKHPADVASGGNNGQTRRITHLNDDLLSQVDPGEVEEIWYSSSHDGLAIQGWIVKPPEFDTNRKYPLILEIHGGPFANYGDRFAAEYQLYAAAGFVVLYTNPRGSTSYGQDFGNAIHHAYPGNDYYDLMSGVDELISRGYIDEKQLFVTGASGGGVLSSWIVGHTDRFAGAVAQKPVINWYSWVLTADMGGTVGLNYWLPDAPWNALEHYMQRSPIHHVGNVVTPTMLITGEVDWRTPMSESEQFYQALKIQKIPAMLVRIPEGNHGFESRPSHLISKVQHILAWFNRYRN